MINLPKWTSPLNHPNWCTVLQLPNLHSTGLPACNSSRAPGEEATPLVGSWPNPTGSKDILEVISSTNELWTKFGTWRRDYRFCSDGKKPTTLSILRWSYLILSDTQMVFYFVPHCNAFFIIARLTTQIHSSSITHSLTFQPFHHE